MLWSICLIIFLLLIFILIQVFFYNKKIMKNEENIKKIESFEADVIKINNNKYILDDNSMKILLDDYQKLFS